MREAANAAVIRTKCGQSKEAEYHSTEGDNVKSTAPVTKTLELDDRYLTYRVILGAVAGHRFHLEFLYYGAVWGTLVFRDGEGGPRPSDGGVKVEVWGAYPGPFAFLRHVVGPDPVGAALYFGKHRF